MAGVRSHNRRTITEDGSGDQAQRVIISDQPIDVNGTFSAGGASAPTITNLSIPSTATEVSHALQNGLKKIIIRSRVIATVQIAFTSTESGTKYITLSPGTVLCLDGIDFDSKTLYAQSDTITTLEILELHT